LLVILPQKNNMGRTLAILSVIWMMAGCGAKDNKNEVQNYPTYDTTQKMENLHNGEPDSSMNNKNNGEGNVE
jgi:hypothetical protein